jgi:predicted transposase YbfD/YdcC
MEQSTALFSHFAQVEDPRVDRTKRYPLIEIIFLVISATISGSEGWKAVRDFGQLKLNWLRKFLPYKEGIPVDDTIARVMRKIDTKQFRDCFVNWMRSVSTLTNGDIIAIDGKTLRGSYDNSSNKSAIHMVSAWSTANSMVLGQEKTSEKSNEITAIPELLKTLELKGCIVSIDAMGCQTKIATDIVKKGADYILALKGNQGILHDDVKGFFAKAIDSDFKDIEHDFHTEYDAGHGRVETRSCWVLDPFPHKNCFSNLERWDKLKRVMMVKSRREFKDKITEDTRVYITSCILGAQDLLNAVRKHWQVENTLHWTLDVTFNEDASRIRKESSPENYAMIRHIALNILRGYKSIKASVKRKLNMAALDDDFRTKLITQVI